MCDSLGPASSKTKLRWNGTESENARICCCPYCIRTWSFSLALEKFSPLLIFESTIDSFVYRLPFDSNSSDNGNGNGFSFSVCVCVCASVMGFFSWVIFVCFTLFIMLCVSADKLLPIVLWTPMFVVVVFFQFVTHEVDITSCKSFEMCVNIFQKLCDLTAGS